MVVTLRALRIIGLKYLNNYFTLSHPDYDLWICSNDNLISRQQISVKRKKKKKNINGEWKSRGFSRG